MALNFRLLTLGKVFAFFKLYGLPLKSRADHQMPSIDRDVRGAIGFKRGGWVAHGPSVSPVGHKIWDPDLGVRYVNTLEAQKHEAKMEKVREAHHKEIAERSKLRKEEHRARCLANPAPAPSMVVEPENKLSNGANGDYFNLGDGIGLKILNASGQRDLKDLDFTFGVREFSDQKRASEIFPGRVPKVYDRITVERDGAFYVGILMEHVVGITFEKYFEKAIVDGQNNRDWYGDSCTYLREMHEEMREAGVIKEDHHSQNVLVTKDERFVIIDWGFETTFDDDRISAYLSQKVAA